MGVRGGLTLMILFILTLGMGYSYLGQLLKSGNEENSGFQFFLWSIGASLFAHAATMISARYFDQSFIFLYLVLAVIGSLRSATIEGLISDKKATIKQSFTKSGLKWDKTG